MANQVIQMPGTATRSSHALSEATLVLLDELQAGPIGDDDLSGLLTSIVDRTDALAAALFLVPPGVRENRRASCQATAGIPDPVVDRVVLPQAVADACAVPAKTHPLTSGAHDAMSVVRVFPPLRKVAGHGLAVGLGSPRRTLGVMVVAFGEEPSPEFAAALETLAWRLSPLLEADLLDREADQGEEKYRILMSGAADAITLYDPAQDRIVDANPAAEELFGLDLVSLIARAPIELLVYLRTTSITEVDPGRPREAHVRRPDGSDHLFEVTSQIVRMGGRALILSIYRDLAERRKTEAALRESEERYALAVEGANDGLWDWDVGGGALYFSPRWKAMLGYSDDLVGTTPGEWFRRVHPDDLERMRSAISAHLEGMTPHFEDEHRIRRSNGSYLWVLSRGLAVRDNNGWAVRMAGSMSDISQRKMAEERLLHAAFHDGLTGLPNRALFMDRLSHVVARSKRTPHDSFAVLFLDLDRFKIINDSLGHSVGDQLLVAIARRLERCLRPADTVARLGGDEFTILLEDVGDIRGATRVADRIHVELVRPFKLAGQEVFTSSSIGIALGASSEDPETLLRNADLAMYQAKANGKARHEVFDRDMHAQAMQLMQLETKLRQALERGELRVHYQPIMRIDDGSLHGFEALVRWQHPERELLGPGAFLEVAEETGLIVAMGRWVLNTACIQTAKWQRGFNRPDLTISVNLAGRQLAQPALVPEVEKAIRQSGLAPNSLVLEITENAVMEHADESRRLLEKLKELGVKLHMDDFGTGLASLAYLRRFPLDTLKIDRSFVSGMDKDIEDMEIVRTIVSLANNLKMGVVAEGIETEKQLAALEALGCDLGQGYLFAKPLPPEEAGQMIS
ncbi:MAG: EAL domain-containing protein [Proteobacteria bacterium]|nr:EAL domain-containing protein [Pseudomonadota bacterium]